jgi:hypothetical protein
LPDIILSLSPYQVLIVGTRDADIRRETHKIELLMWAKMVQPKMGMRIKELRRDYGLPNYAGPGDPVMAI